MKIDRLLGILIMLIKKEKVTAPYLAEYFEVSKRTINRDIEVLSKAGIPIVTKQGVNGGISIIDGYKLDKNIFTKDELSKIIVGLNAINSISESDGTRNLIEKVNPDDRDDNFMNIELCSFYKDSLSEKIKVIKSAAAACNMLKFTYYSKKGESVKLVCPFSVVYKWDAWYLYGCPDGSKEGRMYKLNRLWNIEMINKSFDRGIIEKPNLSKMDDIFEEKYCLKAIFDADVQYLLVESYGDKCYTKNEDGKIVFIRGFTNFDFMLSWVLGFGDKVKVIEPQILVDRIKEISINNLNKYDET